MNGRLYDPKLHRFLQPDNYVQDTENTQNYNRYSYVLNNPLKYTDPSGEKWKITWSDIVSAVAIVAGTVLTFTGFPMIGVPLIGAGVAHFTTALNEFKQTGDWVSASNNAGFIVSFTVKTDFGYDSPKTEVYGIDQNYTKSTSGNGGGSSTGDEKQRGIDVYRKELWEQDNNYNWFYKDKDKALRYSAEYIDNGGANAFTIVMNTHGYEDGKRLASPKGPIDANSLHRFLLANNNTYKASYNNNVQIVVRLEACYAGNGLASEFSKLNPNMIVIAPNNAIRNVAMIYNYVIDGGKYLLFYRGYEYKNY